MSNYVFPMSLPGIALRISKEPLVNVLVQESIGGRELRSTWWTQPRYRYRIGLDFLRSTSSLLELQQVLQFFAARFGMFDSFLLKDPEDYTTGAANAFGFGVGNGSTQAFQLQRALGGPVYDLTGGPWTTSDKPRTNLCPYSEAINSWLLANVTSSANSTEDPAGTKGGDSIIEASDTNLYHYVAQNIALSSNANYCFSCYAKRGAGTRNAIIWVADKAGALHVVAFDLSTGVATTTLGTPVSTRSVSCGNGWWRLGVVVNSASGGTTPSLLLMIANGTNGQYNGDGSSSIYLWGAQCELGENMTERITTPSSAAVTANPSYWPAVGSGFEPVYDRAPGTYIYIDGVQKTMTTDYTISATGLVTFTSAPSSGAVLTWLGEYYRRVRFANPALSVERIVHQMWKAGGVELVSVIP